MADDINTINQIYLKLSELQASLANTMTAVAVCENKMELAKPERMTQIELDINTLKHQVNMLNEHFNQLNGSLDSLNGRINQVFLDLSQQKAEEKVKKEETTAKEGFFTKSMLREISVGVLLAVIFYLGNFVWNSLLDSEFKNRHRGNPPAIEQQNKK